MIKYKEKIVNLETDEITFRDYTSEEILEMEKLQNQISAISAARKAKEIEKLAIFEKLGLTADEATALLG
jgi:hypothetical protein